MANKIYRYNDKKVISQGNLIVYTIFVCLRIPKTYSARAKVAEAYHVFAAMNKLIGTCL